MVSAILSSFNELHNEVFWANLTLLRGTAGVETLVIDGGSQDGTRAKLNEVQVFDLPNSTRAARLNLGIERAKGEMILLVHPRTSLTKEAISALSSAPAGGWGAFRHRFDWDHPVLKFTSWYSNCVRGRRGIFYLDHCLFFSADLKAHAKFPDVPIFEDTYFCARLRKIARPVLLPHALKTSAIRFRKNGWLKQSVKNQILKALFHAGAPASWMNRVYESGLWLNQKK